MGEYKSANRDKNCGVPQGSVLGPTFFLIYINDCKVSKIITFILFADGTNIFSSGESLQQLSWIITSEVNHIKLWFEIKCQ